MVHIIDECQVCNDEVKHTTSAGNRTILLTIFSDVLRSDFSLCLTLTDGNSSLLRLIQSKDKLLIFKDVITRVTDKFKDPILGILKLPIAVSKTDNIVVLLHLELRALNLDDLNEKLVFEALRRHSEVEEGDLDANLRQVVRIGELRGHEEQEIIVVGDLTTTHVDRQLIALLVDVLLEDRFKRRIKILTDVLKKDGEAHLDASLDGHEELRGR